jgi:hypothetical protein
MHPRRPETNRDDHDAASAAALVVRNSPERGSCLRLVYNKDGDEILKAATTLNTNVTSLIMDFNDPISRFDYSSLISFVTAQPNGIKLSLIFNEKSSRFDRARGLILVVLVHEFAEKCPDVHSLRFLFRDPLAQAFPERYIPLLIEALSDSALTRFEFCALYTTESVNLLSREHEQQIAAIAQRNSAIPAYLQTTHLLKRRQPPAGNEPIDPPIMLYANDGVDRPKHQFVLSHALSQAAVHPIFCLHIYEYVRNHVGELFGQPGQMRASTEDAFFVARNDDEKQGAL